MNVGGDDHQIIAPLSVQKPSKIAFIFWGDAVFSSTLKKAQILHYFFAHLKFFFAKRALQTPLYDLQIVLNFRAAPGGGRFWGIKKKGLPGPWRGPGAAQMTGAIQSGRFDGKQLWKNLKDFT